MQITSNEISNTKYVQFYLTQEEFETPETKEIIKQYKEEKHNVAVFVTGKENYPETLQKIIAKQVKLTINVC